MSDLQNGAAAPQAEEKSFISRTSGLKLPDYISYALGDVACCLVFGLVTSLLQKFYTDIFRLNPLFIMLMMIAARVWDAINDPIMGRICDTIKVSRWGRYRPWFLYSSVPLTLASILMFVDFGIERGSVGMMVYATVTYIFFGMAYTSLQIPYGSLAPVVTTDEKERNKLSLFRSIGAGIGSLPVMLITSFCYVERMSGGLPVIGENGEPIKDMAYEPVIIGVIVMSLCSFAMLMIAFKFNKERVNTAPAPKREKGETKRIITTLLKNRAFLSISCAGMLLLAAQMFTQSFNLYLFADFFGRPEMNLISSVCTYAPMVGLILFVPKLIKKFGKKELCAAGIALAAVAQLLMFAVRGVIAEMWWLYLILTFFSGLGQVFILLQVWSIANDAIDDVEIKTGMREDGTSYAMFMFFRKLGQVIAAVAVNGALLGMNYKTEKGAVQTMESLTAMYDLATIIPAVMFGIMAVILFVWYPLNKKKMAQLQIDKEAMLKKKYEEGTIGIDGKKVDGGNAIG